ncbi:MAG: energy-coupling factor transporter transmembrane component T [Calothrix sp. MO_167.B12]|nr:energy-coupling factor transporter transmembrane component T [Calothrix sp. MO_167.B12]
MRISKNNHQRHSFLSQINPLLKIFICIVLISFAFLLQNILSLGVLVGLLLILLFSQVTLKFTTILKVTILLGLFVILSTWLLGDFNKSLFSALRLLAITLPTPLLASTTAPSDLIRALQASRLPGFLVLSLMLIWRFLPIIQQETQRIIEANQLRGINLSRQPRQWFTGLFIPLIFQIVAYADDVTIGLQTRGYDPAVPRSNSQPLIWKMQDLVFAIAVLLIMMGVGYLEWKN